MALSDEDNKSFNAAVHGILETGDSLGDPDDPGPTLKPDDVAVALRLIWKHIGGVVTPSWREEDDARRQAYYDRMKG
jgi:hypothetical protein